jgi:menaquinone-dependent protoporphyrinogen oxidase
VTAGPRVLVTAASRHGGTAELAEAIAEGLRAGLAGRGDVQVHPCAEVSSVEAFDAVVIGSGVYFGHWMQAARELLLRCAIELWERPVWIFSSGPIAPAGPAGFPAEGLVYVNEVFRLTDAREHRVFGGRLDPALLDLPERAVAIGLGARIGDHRDLDAAREWGRGIAAALLADAAAAVSP